VILGLVCFEYEVKGIRMIVCFVVSVIRCIVIVWNGVGVD